MTAREPAPPIGRALRVVLGVALIVHIAPIYATAGARLAVTAGLLVLVLVALYTTLQGMLSRGAVRVGPRIGAALALSVLVALYIAGAPEGTILGRGEGQLAVVTFLGISLVAAGVRADPGCEVMAIPGALLGRHTELACLVFTPLDKLERTLRARRGDS